MLHPPYRIAINLDGMTSVSQIDYVPCVFPQRSHVAKWLLRYSACAITSVNRMVLCRCWVHPLADMPEIGPAAMLTWYGLDPSIEGPKVGLTVAGIEYVPGKGVHMGDGARSDFGHHRIGL